MKKNSIKNTRVNAEVQRGTEQHHSQRDQRSKSCADDFRGSCGSCSGLKDM